MRKRMIPVVAAAAAVFGVVSAGSALAATPERASDPFVCPVLTISEQAYVNSGHFNSLGGGQYTFGPGAAGSQETFNGNVPNIATNGDGSGSPGDSPAPGDTDYTAIWSGNN